MYMLHFTTYKYQKWNKETKTKRITPERKFSTTNLYGLIETALRFYKFDR